MARRLCGWMVIGLLAWMAAAAVADDNGPYGRWWLSTQVVQQLNLKKSETQQLDQAFEKSRLRMIELKARVESEQFKLQSLMGKRDQDDESIRSQYQRLEDARAALSKERFAFSVEVRKILGAERFLQLMEMGESRHRHK